VIGQGQDAHASGCGGFYQYTGRKIQRSAGRKTGVIVKVRQHISVYAVCSAAYAVRNAA